MIAVLLLLEEVHSRSAPRPSPSGPALLALPEQAEGLEEEAAPGQVLRRCRRLAVRWHDGTTCCAQGSNARLLLLLLLQQHPRLSRRAISATMRFGRDTICWGELLPTAMHLLWQGEGNDRVYVSVGHAMPSACIVWVRMCSQLVCKTHMVMHDVDPGLAG